MRRNEVKAITGCNTAHEIWFKLNRIYESSDTEAKVYLWKRCHEIKCHEEELPVKTMIKIETYAQLRSLGAKVDEEEEVVKITTSLIRDRFNTARKASKSDENQTTGSLLVRLKNCELENSFSESVEQMQLKKRLWLQSEDRKRH